MHNKQDEGFQSYLDSIKDALDLTFNEVNALCYFHFLANVQLPKNESKMNLDNLESLPISYHIFTNLRSARAKIEAFGNTLNIINRNSLNN